jgi:hypothetical protein
MNSTTWTCQSDSEPEPGQGAGSAVLTWFQQQTADLDRSRGWGARAVRR